MEDVGKENLYKLFIKNTLPFFYRKKILLNYIKDVGISLGNIHLKTFRKYEKLCKLEPYKNQDLKLDMIIKKKIGVNIFQKIFEKTENIKNERFPVSLTHLDLNLNNIHVNDNKIYIIDFSFDENFSFVDPIIFLMRLEFVKNRLFYVNNKFFNDVSNCFLDLYKKTNYRHKIDNYIWNVLRLLRYCYQLACNEQRHTNNLRQRCIGYIDSKYLIKRIKKLSEMI